jgi:hypothetical protein
MSCGKEKAKQAGTVTGENARDWRPVLCAVCSCAKPVTNIIFSFFPLPPYSGLPIKIIVLPANVIRLGFY